MSRLLEIALSYAARRIPVFPLYEPQGGRCSCDNDECSSIGKHPRTSRGFKDATTDESIVRKWWTDWPNANIGIPTGRTTGIVVVDCDSPEAEQIVKELCKAVVNLDDVPQATTGRGLQLFFSDDGKIVKSRTGVFNKVDIKAEGGYIVASGSRHKNGKYYQWVREWNAKIPPPIPSVLLEPPEDSGNKGHRGRFDTARALGGADDGNRHTTLYGLAGKLRYADIPQSLAELLILRAADECRPPMSHEEALAKVADAYSRYTPGNYEDSFLHPNTQDRAEPIYSIESWQEFLTKAPEERSWTVDKLIPETGLGVIQGRGKHGKSTIVLHLCRSISMGVPFLDRQTIAKTAVYLNFEMPDDYLRQLIQSGEIPQNCFVVNRPEPILHLETIRSIISKIGEPQGLLVIDSFRGAFKLAGKAENLAGEAGLLLRRLQDLAIELNWFFLIVHHRNRSLNEGTDSISGTGDWIAAPDVILTWSRPNASEPGTLTMEGRIPPGDPMAVKLALEECLYVGSVQETKEATDKERILSVLTETGQTSESLAAITGLRGGTVRDRLMSMYKDDLISRNGAGKKNDPYTWLKKVPQEIDDYDAARKAKIRELVEKYKYLADAPPERIQ